jgi:hypothetical protein
MWDEFGKGKKDNQGSLFGAFAASSLSGQFLLWEDNRMKISMDGLMHGNNPGRVCELSALATPLY